MDEVGGRGLAADVTDEVSIDVGLAIGGLGTPHLFQTFGIDALAVVIGPLTVGGLQVPGGGILHLHQIQYPRAAAVEAVVANHGAGHPLLEGCPLGSRCVRPEVVVLVGDADGLDVNAMLQVAAGLSVAVDVVPFDEQIAGQGGLVVLLGHGKDSVAAVFQLVVADNDVVGRLNADTGCAIFITGCAAVHPGIAEVVFCVADMQAIDDDVMNLEVIIPVPKHYHRQTLHGTVAAIRLPVIGIVYRAVTVQNRFLPLGTGDTAYPDGLLFAAVRADDDLLSVRGRPVVDADRIARPQVVPRNIGQAGVWLAWSHRIIGSKTTWLARADIGEELSTAVLFFRRFLTIQ